MGLVFFSWLETSRFGQIDEGRVLSCTGGIIDL